MSEVMNVGVMNVGQSIIITTTGTIYMITTISMVDQLGLNWIVEGVNFEGVSTPQTLQSANCVSEFGWQCETCALHVTTQKLKVRRTVMCN